MQEIFERNINIKLIPVNSDHFILDVSLLDLSHSIHASLKINFVTQEIIDAEVKMMRVPFANCNKAEVNIKNLIGLKIQRGINKEIAMRVGRSEGCTHIVEMLQSAVRFGSAMFIAKAAGYGSLRRDEGLSEEERINRSMSVLKNTCVVFKSDE